MLFGQIEVLLILYILYTNDVSIKALQSDLLKQKEDALHDFSTVQLFQLLTTLYSTK